MRASKKSKAYIHCDDCGFQGFARGYDADRLLRQKMRPVEKTDKETFDEAMENSHKTQLKEPTKKEEEKAKEDDDTVFDKLGRLIS